LWLKIIKILKTACINSTFNSSYKKTKQNIIDVKVHLQFKEESSRTQGYYLVTEE